jgi:prepilin-type N-terminal cleavage/methylation domain-containing protein
MEKRYDHGFTLVELMTTLLIVGVLAVVAVPSYREYVTSSKFAQCYVDMDAFGKAQEVYFYQNKRFVTITPPAYALIRRDHRPQQVVFPENELSWKLLGTPIQNGNLFGYMSVGAFTDDTIRQFLSRGNDADIVDNKQLFQHQTLDGRLVDLLPVEDGPPCRMGFNYAALGVGQVALEDWTIMISMANFNESDDLCTIGFRVFRTVNGEINRDPILFLNKGK